MLLASITVYIFLSAKCPCSISHEPVLREIAHEFAPSGVKFVGVHSNTNEPAEFSRAHFASSKLPFPVVEDTDLKLANKYGALKTPHVFVVSNEEILYQGGVDDSRMAADAKKHYLRDALLAIKEGRKPEPKVARAVGCVISR